MIRNLIVKVTLDCNLNCKYCYVQRNRKYSGKQDVMSDEILEKLIKEVAQYINNEKELDKFTIYWHGGEPLLAGRSFYEKSYQLQKKYIKRDIKIINTVQTNAVLLNKEWIKLFKDIGYSICFSLDGPPDINDIWRQTKTGEGTHDLVVKAMECLKENGIPLSVLSVITPESLERGREIYRYFRSFNVEWMDFMYPFYSEIDNTLDKKIIPAKWGQFFTDVFDEWIEEGNPDVYIRLLHDLCMNYLGGRTSMCSSSSDCSYVVTVDPSGNAYVCDDLLSYSDSLLGNIKQHSLKDISINPKLLRLAKPEILYGEECRNCDYFNICKGGCTLFRAKEKDNFLGRHFYCDAQRIIIDHISNYFMGLTKKAESF